MSLLYAEGFEDNLYKERSASTPTASTLYGRLGGKGLYLGDDVPASYQFPTISLGGSTTLIVGFAANLIDPGTTAYTDILKGTDTPVVEFDNFDLTTLRCVVNSNTLTSDIGAFPLGWNFIEIKVVYHATTGSIEMRSNGNTVGTLTDINTGTAPTTIVPVFAGTGSLDVDKMYLDDVYFCNGAGGVNDDFLGDCQSVVLLPNGNGNSSGMTGSDGNQTDNHLLVDNNASVPPATTEYVGSATEGDKDTYTMDDLSGTPTVFAVITSLFAAKSDTGTKFIRPVVRSGTTDYVGTSVGLSTDYQVFDEIRETDPDTAAAWTASGVNGVQIGQEARDS